MPLTRLPRATVTLLALSVLMAMWSQFDKKFELLVPFFISTQMGTGLSEVLSGQVWRLITPIFIHFSIFHLAFNGAAIFMLGGPIEILKGWKGFLGIVLISGVASNLIQYFMTGSPVFGGLSGVLYALFGYLWMQSTFNPTLNLTLPKQLIAMMLIWFVLCWTGLLGPIANWAHTGGLIVGMILGVIHAKWDVRRVEQDVRRRSNYD